MLPPGIAMQLDELEYFLPGLYSGVVLAIEGKLPFQGLEERLHDGVAARAALVGKRLNEPAPLSSLQNLLEAHWLPLSACTMSPSSGSSLFTALSRALIARFSLMRGDTCHPTILRESRSRRVARQGHPSLVGM